MADKKTKEDARQMIIMLNDKIRFVGGKDYVDTTIGVLTLKQIVELLKKI